MDKIEAYRKIIFEELSCKAKLAYANAPTLSRQLIVSEDQNNFILISFGWVNKRYKHSFVYHIEIKYGKVWIHEDNTDVGIAQVFAENGISKKDIILGFLPKFAQEESGYAVAS